MEDKKIEISTLLRAGFEKTEISNQLDVSRTTIHWVEQRVKVSGSLKNRPRPGRTQVTNQEAIKMAFENDSCQKMKRLS